MRPEQPARTVKTADHLRTAHAPWEWRNAKPTDLAVLRLAHTETLLKRLQHPPDFDSDTPYFPNIFDHARRSVDSAIAAADCARAEGKPAFSLMRPPGHHASRDQAMGFCYLNQIAITALYLRQKGLARVAVWDFDAHHGNGTEEILSGAEGIRFVSVHQSPGYPGTGTQDSTNCRNYPVPPHTSREKHMEVLRDSWDDVLSFAPDLVLVSAGFDAYVGDPITSMTLEIDDFATLGGWLRTAGCPAAAILEGGYSEDLPQLIDSFLTTWADPIC